MSHRRPARRSQAPRPRSRSQVGAGRTRSPSAPPAAACRAGDGLAQAFQVTPHSTCRPVWVRMRAHRRSQSIPPCTTVPAAGTSPPAGARRRRFSSERRPPGPRRPPTRGCRVVRLAAPCDVEGGVVEVSDGKALAGRAGVDARWRRSQQGRRSAGPAGHGGLRPKSADVGTHGVDAELERVVSRERTLVRHAHDPPVAADDGC